MSYRLEPSRAGSALTSERGPGRPSVAAGVADALNIEPRSDSAVTCASDVDLLVSAYCSAWNEPDPQRRLRHLQSIWREDASFDSVGVHVRGLREMSAHIGAFHADCDGWRFVVVEVTAHGRHVHLSWKLLDPTGRERLAGHDVGACAADRRFDSVVSFWRTGATDPAPRRRATSSSA